MQRCIIISEVKMYEKLLKETNEAYYWAGFLISDGYCGKKDYLRLALSIKDFDHLNKLSLFIKRKKPINIHKIKNTNFSKCYIDIGKYKSDFGLIYCKKFDWKKRKTYNPPDIEYLPKDNDLFLSWFAGMVDADGCIQNQSGRKDFKISFHTHKSWLPVYEYINNKLNEIYNITKIKPPFILNSGYLRYDIACIRTVQEIKKFALKEKLPILERKWNIVDLNYIHRYNKKDILVKKIKSMRQQNYKLKEIAEILSIPYHTICYHLYH